MNYKEATAAIRAELRVLHKLNPETARGFGALSKAAMEEGGLDAKTREFLALAIAVLVVLFWNFFSNRFITYSDVKFGK